MHQLGSHADVQDSSWVYPPEDAKVAISFIESRLDVMEPKETQRIWLSLHKEYG